MTEPKDRAWVWQRTMELRVQYEPYRDPQRVIQQKWVAVDEYGDAVEDWKDLEIHYGK